MTVTTSYSPITSPGNGVAVTIPVTWPFFAATDLVVTKIASTGVETVQTLTTHYSVTGGADSDGLPSTGSVILVTAHAVGETIRIERSTPKTQPSEWSESDAFPQATIEAAFDRLTLIAQEGGGGGGTANDNITGDVLQLNSSGAQDFWDGEGNPLRIPFLEVTEASAPATPDSGYGRLYAKTDGDLYYKDDAGTESNLTEGAQSAATSAAAAAASAAAAAADEVSVQALYNSTLANYVQPSSSVLYEHLLLDDIGASFNGATTTFNLLAAAATFTPASAAQLIVHIGGVYQKPGTDYTVASSQITFTTAPDTGLGCTILAQKTAAGVVSVTPTTYWNTVLTTAGTSAASRIQLGTRTSALDSIAASFNGVTTTFNLTVSATAFTPRDVYGVQCLYNGAPQIPGDAFTVSGSQITFTFTPQSGDTCALWAVNA
jgi:hypothetical protein